MGGVVSGITSALMGDPAQNNYSGNYDAATGGMNANIASQNDLIKQIQTQATSGASPSDIIAKQMSNQNLAQTQGLIGSQRGINPGLASREAANMGANINQQAAGQMAAQRAQEQQNANQLQAGIYGNIGNEYTGQQSTAAQSSLSQNSANAQGTAGLMGGIAQAGMMFLKDGGEVQPQNYDIGGVVGDLIGGAKSYFGKLLHPSDTPAAASVQPENGQAKSQFFNPYKGKDDGSSSSAGGGQKASSQDSYNQNLNQYGKGIANLAGGLAGRVGNLASGLFSSGDSGFGSYGAGDPYAGPDLSSAGTMLAAKGGMINGETYAALGKMIPGKAKAKGDNLKNDTVPAMLSPKEIILPRSVTLHPDAPEKAKQFVAAVLAKKRMKK